ncbi:MAG TPA: hypothetical protein VFQ52_02245 [Rhizomicrobium sp.]|nr:hypothetical protein [Rhizomicrobium sp.]
MHGSQLIRWAVERERNLAPATASLAPGMSKRLFTADAPQRVLSEYCVGHRGGPYTFFILEYFLAGDRADISAHPRDERTAPSVLCGAAFC